MARNSLCGVGVAHECKIGGTSSLISSSLPSYTSPFLPLSVPISPFDVAYYCPNSLPYAFMQD